MTTTLGGSDLLDSAAGMPAGWNSTDRDYPVEQCVHTLVEQQVDRMPSRVALRQGDRTLTFAELDERANQLAHHLRANGVGRDVPVGILLDRSTDAFVAVLAVLKAGGYYVPVDSSYPSERIGFSLTDAGAETVVTRSDLTDRLPTGIRSRITVDGDAARIATRPTTRPAPAATPDDLAYLTYTSGSTGRPKGVMVEHRGVVNYLLWAIETFPMTGRHGTVLHSPLGFDFTVPSMFVPLAAGSDVLVLDDTCGMDELADVLSAGLDFSFVRLTPSHLEVLVRLLGARGATPSVRALFIGGEPLATGLVRQWRRMSPDSLVLNQYGATETTIGGCSYICRDLPDTVVVPLGRPNPNMRIYLVDEALRPVAPGARGEVVFAGTGITRGYWHRPELTEERFLPNPFGAGRLYRTGDLARLLPSGDLEFVGRNDHQVKVRGHRIEPGEVEARLMSHTGIARALVMGREDAAGSKQLVAYLLADRRSGVEPPSIAKVRRFCAEHLPAFMVPSVIVFLPAFPMDANGKVRRSALPPPVALAQTAGDSDEHTARRTDTVGDVCDMWAEVFGVPEVQPGDDFFDLGGDSLLAAKVVVRVQQRLGVLVPLRTLFDAPTPVEFAAVLRAPAAPAMGPVPAVGSTDGVPLSPVQAGLWFADGLASGTAEYVVPLALRVRGRLDVAALRAAVGVVVRRHESLRTRVVDCGGEPVQVVDAPGEFVLPVREVAASGVSGFVSGVAAEPVDLAAGRLFRAVLGRVSGDDHVLVLIMHHIISDDWSIKVLADEIGAAYAGWALPGLRVQFGDVAVWQRGRLERGELAGEVAYWRERLAGMPHGVDLVGDRVRPVVRDVRGGRREFFVGADVVAGLVGLARGRQVSLFMVLLAAFEVLVHRFSGASDFGVGTPVAGRQHPDMERLIGFFVNTLVLRADLSGDPTFEELVTRTRETALGAYDHQEVPFDRVVEELRPERDLTRNPLTQIFFALQNAARDDWNLRGLAVERVPVHTGTSKFDIFAALYEEDDGRLRGSIEYSVALFDAETIDRLARAYVTLLGQVVAEPGARVSELGLLTARQRWELVYGCNQTEVDFRDDVCLHEVIAGQAARTPDAVAVEYGDVRVSYAELERRAGRLAARLRAAGVGPDTPVGLWMDRSVDLVVAMVAILKAGGCYVPVETDAPAGRVAAILNDARAAVCLIDPGRRPPTDQPTRSFLTPADLDPDIDSEPGGAGIGEVGSVVDPDNLVSIYYTSGSTGRPKGVASTHRGWVNRMRWMQQAYRLRPGEAVLQKTTLVFDDSAVEFLWPLMVGGRVALLAPGLHRDPAEITAAAVAHQVAVLQFVPSMLTLFLEDLDDTRRDQLRCLRHVISSGEALKPDLVRLFQQRLGGNGTTLHNQWGATEVSIDSTAHHCTDTDTAPGAGAAVSIGRPIANNQVYVLDGQLNPAPIGAPADVYIGGIGLARGYLNDPAKTAAAFLPHPFVPGARLYRTGDRGLRRPDGTITFLGRDDTQIKIRGIRVEPAEVEHAILTHPQVRDAAVTVWEPTPGDKRLAGYATTRTTDLTIDELRAHLRGRLPTYLIPASLTILAQLPTTTSGKTDYKALPPPQPNDTNTTTYQPPEGPVAELIADIWSDLLDTTPISATDNFFDLGGHSLLATKAIGRLRAALAVDLPLSVMFRATTLAELAAATEDVLLAELDQPSPSR